MLTDKNLENRKLGIGASESSAVMGLDKYKTAYQLWREKVGLDQPVDLSDIPQVRFGNLHEETIALEYERVTNQKVRRMTQTLFHKDYPFILCHIDRKIEGSPKVLECKYAMYHSDDWGPSGSDIVPLKYIIQVQHQLAVTGYQEADLAVLISGYDFRIYHFKRDEQIIQKIIEEVSEFWKCVKENNPPPLRDRTDASLAFPSSNGKAKEADANALAILTTLKVIKEQIKNYEAEEKELESKLTIYLEDYEELRFDNQKLCTYKPTSRGNKVLRIARNERC